MDGSYANANATAHSPTPTPTPPFGAAHARRRPGALPLDEARDDDVVLLGPVLVPGLGDRPRHVRVYLPRGERHAPDVPVLYMFDGQNVFGDAPSYAGGWHLHRTVSKMRLRARPAIVAIDHGHERRVHELSPFATPQSEGKLELLLDWMAGSLAPWMQRDFGVASAPGRVRVGGSSLGGLAALYAHFRRPDVFGGALAMSPSIWMGGGRLISFIDAQPRPWRTRVYIDAGALEGGGGMLANAQRLADRLRDRGWDRDALLFRAFKRGRHSEAHWRRRSPAALRFLFGSLEA